jgi:hypothetical protein
LNINIYTTLMILLLSTTFGCSNRDDASSSETENEPTAGGEVMTNTEPDIAQEGFSIILEKTSMDSGETLQISAQMKDGDAITDVSAEVTWTVSDEALLSISVEGDITQLTALKAGAAMVIATYEEESAEVEITVTAVPQLMINAPEVESFVKNQTYTFTAEVINSDDQSSLDSITWESLTSAASISETGELTVLSVGEIEISATSGDLTATWSGVASCVYPEPSNGLSYDTSLGINTVIPPLFWERGYSALDENVTLVSFEDIYCTEEFDWVNTINLVMTSGWCPNCPDYLRELDALNPELRESGGLTIYVEVQDEDYAAASGEFAINHLTRILGSTEGYFVGDNETKPVQRFFNVSSAVTSFPDAFVIRKSDMTIITQQDPNRGTGLLPYVQIAQDPTQEWAEIPLPPFVSNCEPGEEEDSEPNDTVGEAAPLSMGTSMGGICAEGPDIYRVETSGSWTMRIDFSHAESDLDLFQIDEADQIIQRSDSTDDFEILSGSGPAYFAIMSFNRASTTYMITLSE